MTTKLLKRLIPRSLNEALQACKEYAVKHANMSVPRLADRIGSTPDSLYKYLGLGTLPVNKLVAYEEASGTLFVTQYLAHSHGCLLVKIPSGRRASHKQLAELQKYSAEVISMLIDVNNDGGDVERTVEQIQLLMQDLAYHKTNTEKLRQPELFAFAGDDE
ncbi:hypothetical protein [Bowmanella denitrificans]|uniref:hypothetical protein n=1 Tax=Bowmanella denitrificans TaxID=366582 RepID=UPI000C9C51B1|nr:hypothetical protein [Bowmanella denitrificans]